MAQIRRQLSSARGPEKLLAAVRGKKLPNIKAIWERTTRRDVEGWREKNGGVGGMEVEKG